MQAELENTFKHKGHSTKKKKRGNDHKQNHENNTNTTKMETKNNMSINCKISLKVYSST